VIVPGLDIGASLLREGRLPELLMLDELIPESKILGVLIRVLRVLDFVLLCGSILLEFLLVLRELLLGRDTDRLDIEGRDD